MPSRYDYVPVISELYDCNMCLQSSCAVNFIGHKLVSTVLVGVFYNQSAFTISTIRVLMLHVCGCVLLSRNFSFLDLLQSSNK